MAAALVISEPTAERHVANILNKLGFHARSEIDVPDAGAVPPAAARHSARPRAAGREAPVPGRPPTSRGDAAVGSGRRVTRAPFTGPATSGSAATAAASRVGTSCAGRPSR
jgi:hypothetical protein